MSDYTAEFHQEIAELKGENKRLRARIEELEQELADRDSSIVHTPPSTLGVVKPEERVYSRTPPLSFNADEGGSE